MRMDPPDYRDADLLLKLYDLRREEVMRSSRAAINTEFWPKSFEDLMLVTKGDHPLNVPFRQTGTYWDMVYGMARHGIINSDFLIESNGEGLVLFAKVHPYLGQYRAAMSAPQAFQNAQWITEHCELATQMFARTRARVQKALEAR